MAISTQQSINNLAAGSDAKLQDSMLVLSSKHHFDQAQQESHVTKGWFIPALWCCPNHFICTSGHNAMLQALAS